MAIYLNTVTGSRALEGSPFDQAITQAAIKLTRARLHEDGERIANLDLTFLLPAKKVKPDFKGMRIRHYSVEDGTVFIESVVPEKMLHSEYAPDYVLAVIQDAVENAEAFFAEQSWAGFDPAGLQTQLAALTA